MARLSNGRGGRAPPCRGQNGGALAASSRREAWEACHATRAHISLNRKICAAGQSGQQGTVLQLVSACGEEMSLVNASTAWHCIARMELEDCPRTDRDPRIALLQLHTRMLLERCFQSDEEVGAQPRCISTITWALAKLKLTDEVILANLADLGLQRLESFKPFELANTVWGLAKLQAERKHFIQAAHDYILQAPENFSARSLSMIAWAFATMRNQPCRTLLNKIAVAFVPSLAAEQEVNPLTLANMVWALATTRCNVSRGVLRAIADVAHGALACFKAHELSIMLWAFARLCVCHDGLFIDAMGMLCRNQQLREEIHSQGIANLLWAFARHRQEALEHHVGGAAALPDVLGALLPTCLRLLPALNSVELSSSVWSVSKLATSWGQHPAADRIMEEAARSFTKEPRLLAGLAPNGAAGALSAYSDFYCGSPGAPAPCQELIPQLVQLCASFGPGAHRRRAADADAPPAGGDAEVAGMRRPIPTATAAREAAGAGTGTAAREAPQAAAQADQTRTRQPAGPAVAEQSNGKPRTSPPTMSRSGYARAQAMMELLAAELAATVAEGPRASTAACAKNGSAAACASVGGRTGGNPPSATSVPSTRLALQAGVEQNVPSISFVPEFSSSGTDLEEDAYVDVAFEVSAAEEDGIIGVAVDTYANYAKHDSFDLELPAEGAGGWNVHSLRLPQLDGRWTMCLTLLDRRGERIGDPAALPFFSRARATPQKATARLFGSAASTSVQTDRCPSKGSGSTWSSGASGLDPEVESVLRLAPGHWRPAP